MFLDFYRREIKINSQKIFYNKVYSNIIRNKQKLETSQLSIHRRMGKLVYSHTMEHYSDIKKNGFFF